MFIGAERLLVHKEAGMKTHALVAMGAAVFVLFSEAMAEKYINVPGFNPAMIACKYYSRYRFLGAGSIILKGPQSFGSYYCWWTLGYSRNWYGLWFWDF